MKNSERKVFLTGDQSVLWDAPLKLALLSGMGHTVMHAVHTSDCFSRPPIEPKSPHALLTHEAYSQDGNVTRWTATLEAAPMLGRMAISPKEFTSRGVNFERLAWLRTTTVQKIVRGLTEGDWLGISHPDGSVVAHGIRMEEIADALATMRKILRKNIEESTDPSYRTNALDSFDRIFDRMNAPGKMLPCVSLEILNEDLKKRGSSNVALTTSIHEFTQCADHARSKLFPLFAEHYAAGVEAYNEAARCAGEFIPSLEDGDLPFYAVVLDRVQRRLIRVNLRCEKEETVHSILSKVERQYGVVLAVMGKALAHLVELRMRGSIILPQGGSPYAPKAFHFGTLFEEKTRHNLDLHPVFRLHLHALDALEDVPAQFRLPEYLGRIFGADDGWITGADCARRWRSVCEEAKSDADELIGNDPMKLLAVLERKGVLPCAITKLIYDVQDRHHAFAEDHKKCIERNQGAIDAACTKNERKEISAAGSKQIREIERKHCLGALKSMRKAHSAILEDERAKLLQGNLSIYHSLTYWNKRPFTYWVDALPGWYEGIRKRAELIPETGMMPG